MGFSTPYIILNIIFIILSVLSFACKTKLSQKILTMLSMIVFVVFFCFRGYVQTDTINYYALFERLPGILSGIADEPHFDKGFIVYMEIIKSLGFNYDQFIIISTFIDLILLTILFRQYFSYKYYALFFYLFLMFTGLEYEFNLMRNIKATLLFLISIKYIYSRNFIKFLILNLLALSFHWSSILYFPLYFILHKEISLKSYCVLFLVGILIYVLMPYVLHALLQIFTTVFEGYMFTEKIDDYLNLDMFSVGKQFSLMDIALMIWYVLILITYNQIKRTSPHVICFINLFALYFLFSCMGSGMILFRQRVAILFEPSCWLLFIWLIKSQRYTNKVILFSVIVLYGMFLTYRRTKNDTMYQYDNFLLSEKVISMEERIAAHDKVVIERKKSH